MKALAAVFFLTVCAYVGAATFGGLDSAAGICRAELVTVTESSLLRGIAVRREQPVCSPGETEMPAASGEKLSAGDLFAVFGQRMEAACFYEDADGLEHLEPGMLRDIDADGLEKLMNSEREKYRDCVGRLVYDPVWYFAAYAEAGQLPAEGEKCRVLFEGMADSVSARAVLVSEGEPAVLVLRFCEGDEALMRLRECSAELIFSEYTGLKIPLEALRRDSEGNYFVYTLTAGLKECCAVDIIYTGEDFCLAALSPRRDALRSGSSIVLSAEEDI